MCPPHTNDPERSQRLSRRKLLETGVAAGLTFSAAGCLSRILDTPTEITDWHELVAIEDELDGEYEMTADLGADTAGYEEHGAGPDGEWNPIGSRYAEFSGVLDGNGHVITGLDIDQPTKRVTGLFAQTSRSTINNLRLGTASNPVSITGGSVTGGLVGRNEGDITGCYVSGDISGKETVGGLVGENQSPTEITKSSVMGTVSGEEAVGGLVGVSSDTISEASVATTVIGEEAVGGLVGFSSGSRAHIRDTEATGTVSGTTRVGGLVGGTARGDIKRSYAASEVTGNETVGGVVGERIHEFEPATLSGVYWDRAATNQSTAIGQDTGADAVAVGFGDPSEPGPATAMQGEQARENMPELSFGDVWEVVTDPPGYPTLSSSVSREGLLTGLATLAVLPQVLSDSNRALQQNTPVVHLGGGWSPAGCGDSTDSSRLHDRCGLKYPPAVRHLIYDCCAVTHL